jgi:hypothetical protein
MSKIYDDLCAEIRAQTKGHTGDTVEMVGEQLLDMARGDDRAAEILLTDLQNKDMSIETAEKKIRAYADELHKKNKSNCVGVSPRKAEEILRNFYGLPAAEEAAAEIDPFAFL